jgi:hypothetical protein
MGNIHQKIESVQPGFLVALAGMQRIEIGYPVGTQDDRFAIDHEGAFAEPQGAGPAGTSVPRVGMHGRYSILRNMGVT